MSFNVNNLSNINSMTSKAVEVQKTASTSSNQTFSVSTSDQNLLNHMTSKQLDNLYVQVSSAAANVMSNAQQNIFLRDMLGLPKDWTGLLNEFVFNNNTQIANMLENLGNINQNAMKDSLLALLVANSRVNLSALAAQLGKNSGIMTDKLLKYMGTMNMSQHNIAQLKDIMLIGASISGSLQTNPNEFIRDIIQMYLPWLPLVPPKEEDINELEEKMSGGDNKDARVSFYISTNNLGYFKVEVLLCENNEVYISNVSKNEQDETFKESLIQNIEAAIKKASIKAKLFFSSKIDKEEPRIKGKELFIVTSTDAMVGLLLMQLISKTIFEFDDKQAQRFIKIQ